MKKKLKITDKNVFTCLDDICFWCNVYVCSSILEHK